MTISDGSTASYYELPAGCTELQDLISHRNLNAQDGEMFRAIYRKGMASHSDELRDAKKVLFYATAEVKRLEALRVVKDSLTTAPSKAAEIAADDYQFKGAPGWAGCIVERLGVKEFAKIGAGGVFDENGARFIMDGHDDTPWRVIAYRIHKAGE